MFQVSGICNMISLQILIVHVGISVFSYRKKYSNKWKRGCIVSPERYLAYFLQAWLSENHEDINYN